ncbi:MAG TPA: oligopeptide/dipeptide ABC transporter ATP-binding protein [Kaistia sp.]|nr:oligopeptide/dipeptide ABC transporter ATP-binding protein [Kaistia sp.]
MTAEAPILETRDIVKHFGGGTGLAAGPLVHAVDPISLSVNRGETFAIVGESGCGKSTLARLLLRLIEPTSGQIYYEGQDLTALTPTQMRKLRAEMQFIFQDPFSSLNPRMKVRTLVEEPLLVHTRLSARERRTRVDELLRQVGLRPEYADRYPHEFSGGQRQRIGIARALASGPKLLIGDEPVSALDVSVRAQIINLLDELKGAFGLTLVIISHDLAVIRHMSDRVAVMYLGQIVETAPVESLFERPLHPYTQALIQAIPVPAPGARDPGDRRLKGDIPSPVAPPPGCRFHTRCPHAVEICHQKEPFLEAAGEGRFVACHRWSELPQRGFTGQVGAALTPGAERRFALYRERSAADAGGTP